MNALDRSRQLASDIVSLNSRHIQRSPARASDERYQQISRRRISYLLRLRACDTLPGAAGIARSVFSAVS